MDRVLVIRKPPGLTSHDVVERIRRSSRERRVGHAGTLDPSATGLLLVLVGRATRLAQFLADAEKEYRGHMLLGRITDTQDLTGRVLEERPCDGVTRERVERAFEGFTGHIQQVPPMVSALKHQGTPLYALARKGITVERAPRSVLVRRLGLLAFDPPDVEFEVVCSKGTYVRTLAADVGEVLGCGACLGELERRRIGRFTMDAALALGDVEALGRDVAVFGCSMFDALADLPSLTVDGNEAALLATGGSIRVSPERVQAAPGGHVRVTRNGAELLAVGRVDAAPHGGPGDAAIHPIRVFEEV
ncbi:MAG: tRNA pseudouridine(55) synthase TruB [Candidatus Eisenbacteria bacterium]|nr:tRNA pseudouridine(55) synthase TruB [Candidatus Eisenbacteria bacterium]